MHLSPKRLKVFDLAFERKQEITDHNMLLQATYIYEAFATVMANSFGKRKVEWRTKTITEEMKERSTAEKDIKWKRKQHALEMQTMRANFLVYKEQQEG